jgi:hypothetical protein
VTAARHACDANAEALRLHLAIQGLCEKSALGESITPEQLATLLRSSGCVQYHTARTTHAVALFPSPDRRAPIVVPTLSDIPTPLAALEALLAECDNSMDYRTTFRYAMSSAHTAIVNAKNPRPALHGTLELGERIELGDDEDLTFGDLFGEPDQKAFEPTVLEIARGMAATDGAIATHAREVAA